MPSASRTTQAAETRRRIQEAALTAFAERGFHGTSTREIATACGLSPAALYMHYTSKEQVLFEIARAGHLELLAQMSTAVDGVTEPRDRLRCLMHAYVLFHARRATLARVINYELGALSAEHAREIERLRRRIDADVRAVLAGFEGIDPRLAALALESLGIDIARWYRPGGRWSPTSLASSYAEIALRILDR